MVRRVLYWGATPNAFGASEPDEHSAQVNRGTPVRFTVHAHAVNLRP